MTKAKLYFYTIRHLKAKQIYFRFFYFFRRFIVNNEFRVLESDFKLKSIQLSTTFLPGIKKNENQNEFTFLNKTKSFKNWIDWNYSEFGKLWCYNLNYFEYLNSESLAKNEGLEYIHAYISKNEAIIGKEPYPTSLRIVNWLKFLIKYQINDPKITAYIQTDIKNLKRNLEYHLLGNHLLENGLALLFAGLAFEDNSTKNLGRRIISEELKEQILPDGGHFERSPMYHKVLLERILDCYNLALSMNEEDICLLLKEPISRMASWLDSFSFKNGSTAMVNDAAPSIAPENSDLLSYTERLKIQFQPIELKECGYRIYNSGPFELLVDVGDVGPDYIPGHAHSDTLAFELQCEKKPIFVDTGISTYESNDVRTMERSTRSHNTVMINDTEQTEVWGAFRVARRAYGKILDESTFSIKATHTGYDLINANHCREFEVSANHITINDIVKWAKKSEAFFHFHPDCNIIRKSDNEFQVDKLHFTIEGAKAIKLTSYQFANGFNHQITSNKIVVDFNDTLKSTIRYENPISH